MKLYVGNLVYNMTNAELGSLFESHGTVVSARIVTDHFTRQSKCFGYVEMANRADGTRAIATLDGSTINRQRLIIKEARPRDKRMGLGW